MELTEFVVKRRDLTLRMQKMEGISPKIVLFCDFFMSRWLVPLGTRGGLWVENKCPVGGFNLLITLENYKLFLKMKHLEFQGPKNGYFFRVIILF